MAAASPSPQRLERRTLQTCYEQVIAALASGESGDMLGATDDDALETLAWSLAEVLGDSGRIGDASPAPSRALAQRASVTRRSGRVAFACAENDDVDRFVGGNEGGAYAGALAERPYRRALKDASRTSAGSFLASLEFSSPAPRRRASATAVLHR